MASGHPGDAVRQINRLFRDGTAASLTDGQLLERFATRRAEAAEAAFEALVGRHGPMVLRVCRAVLRDPHDVDDAFQATFLVLVRKAHAISERELLAPWLYGVARRVALKARGVAARRTKREGAIVDDLPGDAGEGAWLDLRPMLHEELDRLPEKYRRPVVLCHLQGLTHAEAAAELAWPVGTVSVRLSRARKLLKERLARRGLTVTASLWAAGLLAEGASASVPESLIRSTAKAALAASAGKIIAAGMISSGAIVLTKRTLTMMLVSRLKWLVVPLALGLGAAGGVIATRAMLSRSPQGGIANEFDAKESMQRGDLGPVPPGFFDITALADSGPAPVKQGQILLVEVLEALPGRPITGERVVRPDGTISLGFYGDLPVAGLNRNQIKIKLIEHLRKFINDEVLGLMIFSASDETFKTIPPLESNRVFVDESANYFPSPSKGGRSDTETLNGRVEKLDRKLSLVLKEVEDLRAGRRPTETPPTPR